ncbi:serine O-acetyltransferase [Pseudoalteromonas sp. SWYJZ12]|uniref:serine O-acetyltransferase n=1 Tax=Pseudoalteromonas sp. SWYJZ12 TaxID=2792067 RepID=UPI0018CDDEBA|nr:DapH/DapD/GlmU-related protein [Pseudoalteromonas sp. SWYJZ12]MBH0002152.1 serine acetyltransferase [Pseudoalteromonas sp. SWYJZ12]
MPNAIMFYRVARWFYLKNIPFVPKVMQLIIFILYSSKVPANADIGKGSFLVVKGIGVVIIDKAKIGERCRIGIGCKVVGKGPYKRVPVIGDDVFLGPGCVIVGPVIIGNKVIVAPNSVVTKSVPTGCIVGGIPAKIIGRVDELEYDIFKNESYLDDIAPYMVTK